MYSKTPRRYFFRSSAPSHSAITAPQEYCIQIPSIKDREQMHGMPAGGEEDQFLRLTHMAHKIQQIHSKHTVLPVMTTDQITLPSEWKKLFVALKRGKESEALDLLSKIPLGDTILQALLAAHSFQYLQELVSYSIQAQSTGMLELNSDIIITPGTFEVLIKDIATTLFHSAKVHFSFGLPSHHAFSTEGSGFCILDKTAILLKHMANVSQTPLKFVIIGTDVNRDNGLSYDLMKSASELNICHIDIFDSRVYPQQDHTYIYEQFKSNAKELKQNIKCWSRNKLHYFAVDLSSTLRQESELHPALTFALQQMEAELKNAKTIGAQIMLFLPTGWDSHENETAYCGKYINGRMMKQPEAQKARFSDKDLVQFYDKIFELYHENKEYIVGIYWGLEGGYNRTMYEKQIQLLMSVVLEKLLHQDLNDSLTSSL